MSIPKYSNFQIYLEGVGIAFSENFKFLKKHYGLTNYQISKAIGCHQSSVSNWENGAIPYLRTQQKVASAFSITLDELIGDKFPTVLPEGELPEAFISKKEPAPTVRGDGLSENEKILVSAFRALPKESQEDVLAQIQGILERRGLLPKRCIRHRNIFASARRIVQAY